MGLFDAFKKKEKPIVVQLSQEEIDLQEKLKKQDLFLHKKSLIEDQYLKSKDIDKYIEAYQKLVSDPDCFSVKGSWVLNYPQNLIAAKRYNEAWSALNQILMYNKDLTGHVYSMFYEILKKEDRHHVDAIYYLMASYLLRSKGTVSPIDSYKQDKNVFIKKAKPLCKKVGLSESELEYLSYLLESQLTKKSFSVSTLEKNYRAFWKEKKVE